MYSIVKVFPHEVGPSRRTAYSLSVITLRISTKCFLKVGVKANFSDIPSSIKFSFKYIHILNKNHFKIYIISKFTLSKLRYFNEISDEVSLNISWFFTFLNKSNLNSASMRFAESSLS